MKLIFHFDKGLWVDTFDPSIINVFTGEHIAQRNDLFEKIFRSTQSM